MGTFWELFVLGLVFVSRIAIIESVSPSWCYTFEGSDQGWTQAGVFYWKWSGLTKPNITNIPDFSSSSNYMWLQDQLKPPVDGAIVSSDIFQLEVGDKIESTIFSHINTDEPDNKGTQLLSFITGNTTQPLIPIQGLDAWTSVSVTCVDSVPTDGTEAQCCLTYPCSGNFRVDGHVEEVNDLLVIDNIGINGGCDASSSWCCNFDTDVCDWSPAFISNGWKWSTYYPNPTIDAIATSPYIYIIDTSANATSTLLTNVQDSSTFTLTYYFNSEKYDINNRVEATFISGTGHVTYLSFGLTPTADDFLTVDLPAVDLCQGAPICDGYFLLTVFNAPGDAFTAALDNFSLNNACKDKYNHRLM